MNTEQLRDHLLELARNLLWCWKPWYQDFLRNLDPERFDELENPVRVVRGLSDKKLAELAGNAEFTEQLKKLEQQIDKELKAALKRAPAKLKKRQIAYFSAEYGIHTCLPIYSGGLGVLSGDHIKSAHDLGLPFVGVGLMYRQGYFTQRIDGQGRQQHEMHLIDLADLPVQPVFDDKGEPVLVSVELPERDVFLRVWMAVVGNSRLYLLDADCEENRPDDRALTWQLYGGDRDTRMAQEIILGIGGVRMLRRLGIKPDVWHMNEGHSAFLAVERISELLREGFHFTEAVEAVAANTVFTTHTPVPAGNEAFMLPRLHQYFRPYCERNNIKFHQLLELGTLADQNGYKVFSLTALAIRLSRFANGVSQLHGEVSRNMWYHLWHQVPIDETPIDHVTNGIHTASWVGKPYRDLFAEQLGEDWEEKLLDQPAWEVLRKVDDRIIWERHLELKQKMVNKLRENVQQRLANSGHPVKEIVSKIREDSLFICFARRFATYKRAALIFDDLDRLDRILNSIDKPVTLVFAGKAHPADQPGQELIRRIHEVSLMPRFHGRVILLEGYDIRLARYLVQGCDVWLNNPRRPLEASGTSGMKVCPNGNLNFSILDGWWVEGYNERNGWRIGRDFEYGDDRIQDYYDVKSMYTILEKELAPLYYDRDTDGIPHGWVAGMKDSIITLTPQFSSSRMVNDYVHQYYIPAIGKGDRAREGEWKSLRAFVEYKRQLGRYWYHMTDTYLNAHRENDHVHAEAGLYLGLLSPDQVRVQLFIRNGKQITTINCALLGEAEDPGVWRYRVEYSGPALLEAEIKMRVLPAHEYLSDEMELGMCYWFNSLIE